MREAHSCGLKVLGQSRGGESHLHSEVDDPLDSHERAQLRHLPAAVTGRVGWQLMQTFGQSAPGSVSAPARGATNQLIAAQPRGSQWKAELGGRRNPGRADWKRGRGAEVGERAGLGVKLAGSLLVLSPPPRTSVVPSSAVHVRLSSPFQLAVSVFPRAPCAFPRLACSPPRSPFRFPPHLCVYTFLPCDSPVSSRPPSPRPLRLPRVG